MNESVTPADELFRVEPTAIELPPTQPIDISELIDQTSPKTTRTTVEARRERSHR